MEKSFSKEIKTINDLIAIIKSRDIIIEDEDNAKEILKRISYQRLMAYRYNFFDLTSPKEYKDGISFEKIYKLYKFDRDLKFLLYKAVENIELMLRTMIAYHLGLKYGNHGYLRPENFVEKYYHKIFIEKILGKVNKSHKMVKYHYENHRDELPIYKAMELTTFGQISKLFKNLKEEDKTEIIKTFKNKDYKINTKIFTSWLINLTDLRNICAHYDMLWNRKFEISPLRKLEWKASIYLDRGGNYTYSIFGIFLILKTLIIDEQQYSYILENLSVLFDKYKDVISAKSLYFPENWKEYLN